MPTLTPNNEKNDEVLPGGSPIGGASPTKPSRAVKKEEYFDAIAPRNNGPMIVSTSSQKGGFGKAGWLFFLLFLVAVGALGYMYVQLQAANERAANLEKQNPAAQTENSVELSLLERVAQHIMLPLGQPKVSAVTDAESIKRSQSLYTRVQNGDQIITYDELEIVYNPTQDVLVHVRPLSGLAPSSSGQSATSTESRATQGVITVDIRNGSGVVGLAARTAESLKGMAEYQVKNIGNASKSTYNTTIIVNLTGKNIAGLEKQFKTTAIAELPVGEAKTTSDVVIIVGKQQ